MFKGQKIGVVVPAYNEEKFVGTVINTVPGFVDKIFVVNDASTDHTGQILLKESVKNNRVVAITRSERGGVGAAIITGHKAALEEGVDVIAIMAGDGQMDPDFLPNLLEPVVEGRADYAKGNRLSNHKHREEMPVWRAFGNYILTNINRISTGYYHISDPQDGYTAISTKILKKLDLDGIEKGYAFENDMLIRLNCIDAKVVDIPHPAVYRGEKSKIRYPRFIIRTSWIFLKGFIWRIWMKYIRKPRNSVKVYSHG
jgi:glycosyltransferase involved in cell wall biosynthesis